MTRAESYELRDAIFHENYMKERERRLKYAADYYQAHKEAAKEYARKRRAGLTKKPPEYERPSTEAFEEELPLRLKMQLSRIREQYLKIPITERPIYDYYLRCRTIEHLRDYERERRKYNHPDIIKPDWLTAD